MKPKYNKFSLPS